MLLCAYGCRHSGGDARFADLPAQRANVAAAADALIGGVRYQRLDLQANLFTGSDQSSVAIDQDRYGNSVVVWHSRRQEGGTYGVFARRFNAAGGPLSDEVHVNAYTQNMQARPAVSVDASGSVWFAWESFGQDGDRGGIVARKFDAALSTATREVLVNATVRSHQSEVALAAGTDGGAVIAWTSVDGSGAEGHIYARRFGADGTAVDDEFRVDTAAAGMHNRLPCVGIGPDGGFTIVWARTNPKGHEGAIVARRFDAAGSALGGEFAVSEPDGSMHIEPALAVNDSGAFVVGWLTQTQDDYVIHVRRFETWGAPPGGVRRIETGTVGHTTGLGLAIRRDGRYIVCWSVYDDIDDRTDLFARIYDSDGEPAGQTFRVTAAADGNQRIDVATGSKRLTYHDDGRLAFAWSGSGAGKDKNAANLTLLLPEGLDVTTLARRTLDVPGTRFDAIESGASPHMPPTFDPDRAVLDREVEAAAAQAGAQGFGFLGISNTGWSPPDPHIAVGPEHLVLIANGKIAFFDKNGTLTFQQRIEDGIGFWGELGTTTWVFDPEVIYDPHSSRFMAIANERTDPNGGGNGLSMFLLAVSDDADPNGTWYKYRLEVSPLADDSGLIDSPNIGVDAEAVYLTADFLGPPNHLILMIDKDPLLAGQEVSPNHLLIPEIISFGVPVIHGDASAMYLIEAIKSPLFEAQSISVHAITDPLGTPQLETVSVSTAPYRRPEKPPQMGSSARVLTFDARFWSCVYRNGSLWATHHITRSAVDPRVIQRWYQIDLNGWPAEPGAVPAVAQWGDIDPGGQIRTFFGSIAVDPFDNMGMVVARSSPTEFISIGRTGRLADDPPGTTRPVVVAKSSTSSVTGDPPRWGDYSGIVVDPVDNMTFWHHHEYRTAGWLTWVGTFSYFDTQAPQTLSATPFDGYIDPRSESSDGTALDRSIDHLTITFSERVVNAGGAPLSVSAFSTSVTGGQNPGIRSLDAAGNPTIEIRLRNVIPVQQYTTIQAQVEDLSGNAAVESITYGFLPADVSQDGEVSPLDLIRFREYLNDLLDPPQGTDDLFLDVDRDGMIVPQDLIRFRQLLNGTGTATRAWLGESLP